MCRRGTTGKYAVPKYDFDSAAGAVAALKNPNYEVRYLAWTSLRKMGADAETALRELWHDNNPRIRARALWLLGKIDGKAKEYVDLAIEDNDPNIRIAGLRLARQLEQVDLLSVIKKLAEDSSVQVRRECAIALREVESLEVPGIWATLAKQHDGNDRWYLEALGIAADGKWDKCFDEWLNEIGKQWATKAGRDIIWRSRATQSADFLARIIRYPYTEQHELPKYFRAFDFLDGDNVSSAILEVALDTKIKDPKRKSLISREAFKRLDASMLNSPLAKQALNSALDAMKGSDQFVSIVERFNVKDRYPELLNLAKTKPSETVGINAIRTLLGNNQNAIILDGLADANLEDAQQILMALGNSADNRAAGILERIVWDEKRELEMRRQSVRQLAKLKQGASHLLMKAETSEVPTTLKEVTILALTSSNFRDIRSNALKMFPSRQSKDAANLPAIPDIVKQRGEVKRGETVFAKTGTCAKCHLVNKKGTEVGPDLSKIGAKLSRQAMFESIIYPSAGISHNYEMYSVVLADGNVIDGLITSRTDEKVVVKNKEGVVRELSTSDVEEIVKQPVSLMPADLYKLMTQQELVDVVEYMTTLK